MANNERVYTHTHTPAYVKTLNTRPTTEQLSMAMHSVRCNEGHTSHDKFALTRFSLSHDNGHELRRNTQRLAFGLILGIVKRKYNTNSGHIWTCLSRKLAAHVFEQESTSTNGVAHFHVWNAVDLNHALLPFVD